MSWRLFEGEPRHVDRFGLLLAVTTLAVATLALVDLRPVSEGRGPDVGVLVVTLFVGAALLLALRSSGVSRRFRSLAGVLIGIGFLTTVGAIITDSFGNVR